MEKFFVFGSRGYLTTFAASPDLFEDAIYKGLCGFHSGREIHDQLVFSDQYPCYIQFPVVFHRIDGKRMRDLLDMRYTGSHFLISERLKSILEENQFTGWKSYPIELYDKKGNPVSGYSGFSVTGHGGRVYYPFNKGWDSVGIDYLGWNPAGWDGSDFFGLDNTRQRLVTEKVMHVLKKNRVDAVDFDLLEGHGHFHYDSTAGKREAGYAVFSTVHQLPSSYQKPLINYPLDGVMSSLVENDLKAGTLVCIENCLELIWRYGNAGCSTSNLSLISLEEETKTEQRCYRHIALIESLDCCGDAVEYIDNAAYLLHCESDSPAFLLNEFPSIPDYHIITNTKEWDSFMDWHIATLRFIYIDVFNALTDYFEHLHNSDQLIKHYLENALTQLAQCISILDESYTLEK